MSSSVSLGYNSADILQFALLGDYPSATTSIVTHFGDTAGVHGKSSFLPQRESPYARGGLLRTVVEAAGLGSLARLFGASGSPASMRPDEDTVRATIKEILPLTKAALSGTESGLRDLMERWDISPYFRGCTPDGLVDILLDSHQISYEKLSQRLHTDSCHRMAVQRFLRAADVYVMIILSGKMVPPDGHITTDAIARLKSDFDRLGKYLASFKDATDYLATLTTALDTLHPMGNTDDDDWKKTLVLTKCALQDLDRMCRTHLAVFTLITDNMGKDQGAVQRYTDTFHSLGTIGSTIAQARSLSGKTAEEVGVLLTVPQHASDVRISDSLQMPTLAILHALLDNAIKFSSPSRRKSDAVAEISTSSGEGSLTIDVTDNGVGIKDIRGAESGVRLRPDLAPGLGNSLRNSLEVANRHGIELSYQPRTKWHAIANAGSTFSLRFGVQVSSGSVPCVQSAHMGTAASPTPPPVACAMAGGIGMIFPSMPGPTIRPN